MEKLKYFILQCTTRGKFSLSILRLLVLLPAIAGILGFEDIASADVTHEPGGGDARASGG